MRALESYVQPLLLVGILIVSMMLHATWILDSSYEPGDLGVDEYKDTLYMEDGSMKINIHQSGFNDLTGWYRSSE